MFDLKEAVMFKRFIKNNAESQIDMSQPEIPYSWKDQPTIDLKILDSDDPVYKRHVQN